MQEEIRDYAASHSRQETLKALHDAFSTRGERVAAAYIEPQSGGQLQRFGEAIRTSPTARDIQTDLAQSPMQQFEQMLSNVANIGNTLATTTLPGLNTALQTMNSGLTVFNQFLHDHPTATTVAGYGLGGGLMAGAVGLAAGSARGAWNLARGGLGWMFGGGEAAAESLTMGGEAASAGGALGPLGLLAGLSIGAHSALQSGSDYLQDALWGKGDAARTREILAHGGVPSAVQSQPLSPVPPQAMSPADAAAAAGDCAPAAAPAAPNITIQVHNTMNGVADESTFHSLLVTLTDTLRTACSHTSGGGHGSDNSIYVSGGS